MCSYHQTRHGGKCTGSNYWKYVRSCMEHLGLMPCKAEPDIWMKQVIVNADDSLYWEYVLLYIDNKKRGMISNPVRKLNLIRLLLNNQPR